MTAPLHHILLVEDNAADVFLLQTFVELAALPLHLQVATDGVHALELLEQDLPHSQHLELLLIDLNMPRMNGFELLDTLKSDERWRHLPVVVLTTSHAPPDRVWAMQLGADAFLCKPHGFNEITELLRGVLNVLGGQGHWADLQS